MSNLRRVLILVVVMALPLALMATAAAKKPDCSLDPTHPSCGEDPSDDVPMGGTVCDPAEYPNGINGVQTNDFTFTLEVASDSTFACVDVLSAAGEWKFTVTASRARSLLLVGRDSIAPGDACDALSFRRDAIPGSHSLVMPAATINACGTGYSEWVSLETEGLNPLPVAVGGDCAAFDDAGQCLVAE